MRHPERVSHLVLYGGFALGGKKRAPTEKIGDIEIARDIEISGSALVRHISRFRLIQRRERHKGGQGAAIPLSSFDCLIGTSEQRWRHGEVERLGGLKLSWISVLTEDRSERNQILERGTCCALRRNGSLIRESGHEQAN